ncbi:hypothetical protein J7E73_08595 [Paenibacillus albidus]|uniref:hypothetical protein n=1 Tax=Paenibacillus albidus TaxID=2041023 RepID=UPI001BE599E8|nr:hypothetical protein [Paenibacillus albidus]MBT2289190.1 hypothetical protein [Paenibacillus albidus]
MQQKVELDRLLELEQGMKRLNRTLEEQVAGMHKTVSEQVRSAQSAYPESSDVRSPAQDLERLLRETRDLAASISSRLYQKESTLRWAVGQYQSTEKQARNPDEGTAKFYLEANEYAVQQVAADSKGPRSGRAAGSFAQHAYALRDDQGSAAERQGCYGGQTAAAVCRRGEDCFSSGAEESR